MANPEEFRGTVPPNSVEAEVSVLGAMLQDSAAVLRATEQLRPEDFYQPEHKEIFSVMMDLYLQRRPIDLVTLHTELARRGSLEGVGGNAYLMKILNSVPTSANVKAYIDIVQEKSTMRKLIQACQKISGECFTQQSPLENILSSAEKAIFDIVMNQTDGETLVPLREVLVKTYDQIDELSRLHGAIGGVPTGFIDLDNLLTGLHPGELVVVGARPSMGKTSFAMNIASYASLKRGKSVAVFTLEMPREQIAMRMLCSDAQVDMQRVRKGTLTDKDWSSLANSVQSMADAPMYIDDTAGITPSQLRSRCRRLKMDKGLDLVVVDYLGLMKADGRVESRQLEVSEISRQLKAIALDMKIPIIACAQLSRANKDRVDKRPVLSDLRDSGSIEQDADVVMFLHREEYYNKDTEDKNIGEVIISKQRSGPLGTVKLAWLSEYTTFANLARDNGPSGDAPW
ncbi:replicative DNA helicase [Clostridiales bacterium]|nr:replicative DNA helicase [Clostridiales bacterium]